MVKVADLPSATTPADGSDLLIIHQGNALKKITKGQLVLVNASDVIFDPTGLTLNSIDLQTLGQEIDAALSVRLIASGTYKITVGTVAPVSPSVGDIWIDTN